MVLLNATVRRCLEVTVLVMEKSTVIAEGIAERSPGHPLPSELHRESGANPPGFGSGVLEGHVQPTEQVQS